MMSQLVMTMWDGAGAVPPMMSVARSLVSRGHHVRVLADPVLRPDVEAAGATHISWTRAPHRVARSRETLFIPDWVQGFPAMRDNLAVGPAAAFAADVREEIERRPASALLTEGMLFGPLVAAEAAGVPSVVLNTTINTVPAEGVPPFGPGFLPATTDDERERDRLAAAHAVQVWDEALPALNVARANQGLPPLEHVLDQARSAALVLVLTSAAFDLVGSLPPHVKHVGPRLDDLRDCGDWRPPEGDEPLVLVAMSSDFQDQYDTFRRALTAVGSLPVRGIATTGHGIDPEPLQPPPNVAVHRLIRHSEVLSHAAAVVTHGGHGTTIKALAAGVPIVCLPMGRDQLDIAARIVDRRVGIRLAPSASSHEIAKSLREVLTDPTYRNNARKIASAIARETTEDHAITEIENLVGEDNLVRA